MPIADTTWGIPAAIDALPISPAVLIGVGLIIVSLSMISMRRRRVDLGPGYRDYTREHASLLRQQQGVKDDMQSLLVQLSELARQINSQIDTRFAKMEQVIADADERIRTLEELLRKAAGVAKVDVVVADEPTPAEEEVPVAAPEPEPQPVRPSKADRRRKQNKQKRPAQPQDSRPPEPTDPRYARIYAMADEGLSAVDISRQTGQTTGEIELILNLRKSTAR